MTSKGEPSKRSVPRRLLSFDSMKSKSQTLGEGPSEGWASTGLVESPKEEDASRQVLEKPPSKPSGKSRVRKLPSLPLRSGTPEPSPMPSPSSMARWDTVRRYVLQTPTDSRPQSPQPSVISSSSGIVPPRSATPKPSRFARLGFRQVVEQAREVAMDDSRRFVQDIQRTSLIALYGDLSNGCKSRPDRDPFSTGGSSLHLPFIIGASHSMPGSANASAINLSKGRELRRPQSVQSLSAAGRVQASVKPLYSVIAHATSIPESPLLANPLPFEPLVLSALLTPFLTQEASSRAEEERKTAFETFDLVIQSWPPQEQSVAIERCLWCCKALVQRTVCGRLILSLLRRMIPYEPSYSPRIPSAVLRVAQTLFSLLPAFQSSPFSDPSTENVSVVKDILNDMRSGGLQLDTKSVEQEYKAETTSRDNVAEALIVEALARCLEHSISSDQRWLLVHLFEEYWLRPAEGASYPPLTSAIYARAIRSFSFAAKSLITKPADPTLRLSDGRQIVHLLRTRILPLIHGLDLSINADRAKEDVVRVVLEVMMLDVAMELTQWATSTIAGWYRQSSDMTGIFESTLRRIAVEQEWKDILRLLSRLLEVLPQDVCQTFLVPMIPSFFEHLADNAPPAPNLMLSSLLQQLASAYPRIFYRPLFSCAASTKDIIVVNHLRILTAISKFLTDLWIRDAEMVAVALVGDAGNKASAGENTTPTWGNARPGQSVILVEIISSLQGIRHRKEGSPSADQAVVEAMRFGLALEARLTVGLEAKEKSVLVPPGQRSLYCILFREIRLLTKSLKPAPWLSRTITWLLDAHNDDHQSAHHNFEPELQAATAQIHDIYRLAQQDSQTQKNRRSTLLLSPTVNDTFGGSTPDSSELGISALLEKKKTLLESLSKGFAPKALKLFVAVSASLSGDDLRRLARLLWVHHIDAKDQRITTPACFLLMQCAEKEPSEISTTVEVDLRSSDTDTKLGAIRKLSILSHWRFQLMSQRINMDRTHRPFKLARGPLPFIATDMGSSQFEVQEDPDELKDNLPLELRKQLAEIGWASEDDEIDQRLQLIKTPLTILPTHHIDRLDVLQEQIPSSPSSPNLSPGSSPGRGDKADEVGLLLRRNSSTGGPLFGVKRKAVFVPPLSSLLPQLTIVALDPDLRVSSAARSLLLDFMRNDPALLIRPVLDLLSGDNKDVALAITYLQTFLHIRHVLPPPMTHYLFNNLAGLIKFISRQMTEAPDALRDYAYILPIISSLVPQVHSLSVRDIRRAKVETLLLPTGNLWFPPSAPSATIFPRSIQSTRNPFEDSMSSPVGGLVYITMCRLSQNMLYLDILKKNPQDVQYIRKNVTRIALPSLDEYPDVLPLELKDYVARKARSPSLKPSSPVENTVKNLSLILSRSYLLLIAQVFRSMPRHLNDRSELSVLVDGLNRILLAHGEDIGIVAHTMIALMVASTRFRRMFVSGGYTLFMPAVIKVYVESQDNPGIRSAIEYATNRFHALHQEAFVFQSLEAAAHLMTLPDVDGEWFAKGVFSLFSSLRKGAPMSADAAGIHDANKIQEREALLMKSVEEQPQTLFRFLRSDSSKGRNSTDANLPEEYESKAMSVDNFVRLILTVIAHDPSTVRAELFLRLFRYLVPSFYGASSSVRAVLSEAVTALPTLLLRVQGKGKNVELSSDLPSDGISMDSFSSESFFQSELFDKSKQPSNALSMRQDYLHLIIAYCQSGGDPRPSMTFVFGTVDQTLKESNTPNRAVETQISTFLKDFSRAVLLRESVPSIKEVNLFLEAFMSIVGAHATTIDLAPVLDVIIELTTNQTYSDDASFAQAVVNRVCVPALSALERVEGDKKLKFPAFQNRLVILLARCVPLPGVTVITLIERRKVPSYEFLSGIVFPFALAVGTGTDVGRQNSWSDASRREVFRNVWIRLVAYAMEACRGPPVSKGSESFISRIRGKSSASHTEFTTLAIALQIIKLAAMRAGDDLSASLPSIWTRLAILLRSLVKDGGARFALAGGDNSANTSPMHTPRSSGQFDNFALSVASDTRMKSPSIYNRAFHRPRMVDYLTWSLLEFICLYRTPLSLHMKMSIREKMVFLEQDLQHQTAGMPSSPSSKRLSSMFSKPRRYLSGLPSPGSSPRLSPVSSPPFASAVQSPTISNPQPPSSPNLAPHIVHLGPAEANPRRPYSSPGELRDTSVVALRSARVKSLPLIQATYRRIRVVQTFMGYGHTLLPMPRTSGWGGETDSDEVEVRVWTKRDGLQAVVHEMKDLMDEFEEFGLGLDDEVIVVESAGDQTLAHSPSNASSLSPKA